MEPKKVHESKTIIAGLLIVLIAIADSIAEGNLFGVDPELMVALSGILMVVLRHFTNRPVTPKF